MGKTALKKEWSEEDRKHLLHGAVPLDVLTQKGSEMILDEGHGIVVKDVYGKEYIDALGGAISVNLGYGRKELAEAAMAQMVKLSYGRGWRDFATTPSIEYASELAKFTPKGLDRFFFANSGSEANETAYKIARFAWINQGKESKTKIISRQQGYHGLNLGAMSATGVESLHKGMGPLAPGFIHIATPYCYRCEFGKQYPDCNLECAEALADTAEREGEDTVAAFVAEPVNGATGSMVPPPEYWPRIRQICTERNILLIIDEVLTGFGRTGKKFACEHSCIIPDMMLMGKGITSTALPFSAVALNDGVFQKMLGSDVSFNHFYTCGAHPVCCAVAMKTLEILIRENLVENAAKVGKYMLERLKELEEYPYVGEVRGLGLVGAFEVVQDKHSRVPDSNLAEKLVGDARKKGLIIRVAGTAIQLGPPLITTEADIDRIMNILKPIVAELKS